MSTLRPVRRPPHIGRPNDGPAFICRMISLAAVGLILLLFHGPASADAELQGAIRIETERLPDSGRLSVSRTRIAAGDLLAEVYARRDFAPAWDDPKKIESLLTMIRSTFEDGLRPADYNERRITEFHKQFSVGRSNAINEQAEFDLLMTDSLIRVVTHLGFGKVNFETLEPAWKLDRPLNDVDPATVIQDIIDSGSVPTAIKPMLPRSRQYHRLKSQLEHYRALAEAGGWPMIADGPSIRPDDTDSRVTSLQRRLAISGDVENLPDEIFDSRYGHALQQGVRRFQARHGLDVDAIVGPATLRALNVPVEQRIQQIRLNLERARWLSNAQGDDSILINIAGFRAYVVRDGQLVWKSRVVVGEIEDKTPLLRSTLKYVVFNPTWTVPRSIATEEMLPKIRLDTEYLSRGGYDLLDSDGDIIDPLDVDWSNVTLRNFRFTIVQRPGPANELGQIKFMFPNELSICMHDTPTKSLFSEARRAFSHGCIRVDRPIELAEVLLVNDGWTRQQIDSQVKSQETTNVFLSKPLPILVLYWTAEVDEQGLIQFYDDIYNRDGPLLEALNERFD